MALLGLIENIKLGLETAKLILENICLLGAIIVAIRAFPFFKYKVGAEERKLYLDNANKVREVLGFVYQHARIDDANITKLGIALNEAALYLNKDIVVFIDEIRKDLINLLIIQIKLDKLEVGDERTKLCDEMKDILIKLDYYADESTTIYRKHIIDESMVKFEEVTQRFKNFCKRKTKADYK